MTTNGNFLNPQGFEMDADLESIASLVNFPSNVGAGNPRLLDYHISLVP